MQTVRHVAEWAALLPLLAVVIAGRWRKLPSADVILLAVAFSVSFLADAIAKPLFDRGIPNLWLTYLSAPVQFAIVMTVVAPRHGLRVVWGFFLILAALSVLRSSPGVPETVVQVMAGLWIGLVVYEQRSLGAYRLALLVYFVGTVPFLLALPAFPPAWSGGWLVAWLGYQAARVAGLCLFTFAVLRPRLRLEVADARDHGIRRGHRSPGRRLGLAGGSPDRAVS